LKKKIRKPLPDDQLAELLKEKGPIARRTIAKYREQHIPVARMRKKI
jgi:RNA polymerase sigma-54 factor